MFMNIINPTLLKLLAVADKHRVLFITKKGQRVVKILLRIKIIEVTKTTDWVCVDIQVVGLCIYLPGHNQESGTKPYLVSVSVQQLVDKD